MCLHSPLKGFSHSLLQSVMDFIDRLILSVESCRAVGTVDRVDVHKGMFHSRLLHNLDAVKRTIRYRMTYDTVVIKPTARCHRLGQMHAVFIFPMFFQ